MIITKTLRYPWNNASDWYDENYRLGLCDDFVRRYLKIRGKRGDKIKVKVSNQCFKGSIQIKIKPERELSYWGLDTHWRVIRPILSGDGFIHETAEKVLNLLKLKIKDDIATIWIKARKIKNARK